MKKHNAQLHPEFDHAGYPTPKTLLTIKKWLYPDYKDLMRYVLEGWKYSDWGWSRCGRRYFISTGGWSGNEEIIGALQANWMFWSQCWYSSRCGGHYVFKLPKPAKFSFKCCE